MWGILSSDQDTEQEKAREEFQGNEEFSQSSFQINRKDTTYNAIIFKIMNLFVVAFFITICVSSFIYTTSLKTQRTPSKVETSLMNMLGKDAPVAQS